MAKNLYYEPKPIPAPPPGWQRGAHPVLFAFIGAQGLYTVRQCAARTYTTWLQRTTGTAVLLVLPTTYDLCDALYVVEDYDAAPYEITDAMTRRLPWEEPCP